MSLLPITAFGILPERVATDVVGRISSVASFSVVASSVVVSVVASSVVLVVSSAANLSLLASSIASVLSDKTSYRNFRISRVSSRGWSRRFSSGGVGVVGCSGIRSGACIVLVGGDSGMVTSYSLGM